MTQIKDLIERLEGWDSRTLHENPALPAIFCQVVFGDFSNKRIDQIEQALDGDLNAALALVEEKGLSPRDMLEEAMAEIEFGTRYRAVPFLKALPLAVSCALLSALKDQKDD